MTQEKLSTKLSRSASSLFQHGWGSGISWPSHYPPCMSGKLKKSAIFMGIWSARCLGHPFLTHQTEVDTLIFEIHGICKHFHVGSSKNVLNFPFPQIPNIPKLLGNASNVVLVWLKHILPSCKVVVLQQLNRSNCSMRLHSVLIPWALHIPQ